jgi:hypothetical protein
MCLETSANIFGKALLRLKEYIKHITEITLAKALIVPVLIWAALQQALQERYISLFVLCILLAFVTMKQCNILSKNMDQTLVSPTLVIY